MHNTRCRLPMEISYIEVDLFFAFMWRNMAAVGNRDPANFIALEYLSFEQKGVHSDFCSNQILS